MPPTDSLTQPRDSIPRLHRIVDHPADQLIGIAAGANTFEDCRLRYGETSQRLQLEGRGRATASRVGESERYWAPTRDLLQELIRWGAIEPVSLPSSRKNLDAHRERSYELTEKGRRLAEMTSRRGDFTTAVSEELIAAHPYFRRLLEALASGPVICPLPTEGDVARGRGGTTGWASWAAGLIGAETQPEAIRALIHQHLNRRFASRPSTNRPTNKAIAETLTDALAVAGFAARGISVDGPTIKTLQRWGTELLIFDQSRYVPEYPSANVIWSACDFDQGPDEDMHVRRRGRERFGADVAEALVSAFRDLYDPANGIAVPVHRIRAQAAFKTGVTRSLVDLVLADLIDGAYPQLGVSARAFIGSCELPNSEPAFRHRKRIRLEVQMVSAETKPNEEEE
jgi:hypothetical protein